ASDVRARLITVGPVVAGTDVLHPLRWVRKAGDALARSARLEQENGGVGAVQQAARDDAARRPGADDHVVVTSGERLAAPEFAMTFKHSRSLPARAGIGRPIISHRCPARWKRTRARSDGPTACRRASVGPTGRAPDETRATCV